MTRGSRNLKALRLLAGRFLRPYWKAIVFYAVLNVAVGVLFSLRPVLLTPALDFFVQAPTHPARSWWELNLNNVGATLIAWSGIARDDARMISLLVAVMYAGLSAVAAYLGFVVYAGNQRVRAAVRKDMTLAVHRHVLTLPLSYFHERKAGHLVSRLTYDVGRTSDFLDSIPRETIRAAARLVVTAAILVATHAKLAMMIVLVGLAHASVTRILAGRVKKTVKALSQEMAESQAALQESITSIRLIKSFGAEKHDAKKISQVVERARSFDVTARLARYAEEPIRLVVDSIVAGTMLWLAFDAIGQGVLSPQAALIYFYLAHQTTEPLSALGRQLLGIQQLLASASPVLELLNEKSILVDGTERPEPLRESIEIEKLSFSYRQGSPVLQDINLSIRRGEMVALVGPSGAGKSTLVDLILRFYDPDAGQILYDGVDLRRFRQREYRQRFGVVSQETLLLNASVRENILFGKPEDLEALHHALRLANADEFVRELPHGLDTVIGDRGVRLSGGQRQRLSIARALYHRPDILILDEATSALDSESERAVQKAIQRIAKEITLIVIAHRLSTILHADKIVVLHRGRIEAIGRHRQVYEISPTYRRLCELQFGSGEHSLVSGAAGI